MDPSTCLGSVLGMILIFRGLAVPSQTVFGSIGSLSCFITIKLGWYPVFITGRSNAGQASWAHSWAGGGVEKRNVGSTNWKSLVVYPITKKIVWVKQCHKSPMTQNNKHTTYLWWVGRWFMALFYPHYIWRFPWNRGTPGDHIHFNWILHSTPSIWGTPLYGNLH